MWKQVKIDAFQDLFWRPDDEAGEEVIKKHTSFKSALGGNVKLQNGWDLNADVVESKMEPNAFPYTTSGAVFKENHALMWMIREQRAVR